MLSKRTGSLRCLVTRHAWRTRFSSLLLATTVACAVCLSGGLTEAYAGIFDPDIIVSALSGPSTGVAGDTIIVLNTVENDDLIGTGSGFWVAFYLSTDGVLGGTDTYIGLRWVSTLGAYGTSTESTYLQLPQDVGPGSYYVIAHADSNNAIVEDSETNNTAFYYALTIAKPNLKVVSASAPSSPIAGSSMSLSETIRNDGGSRASASTAQWYLSKDNVVGASDTSLRSRGVPVLYPGTNSAASGLGEIPIDTPSGYYYLLVKADASNGVDESSESDNTYSARYFQIGPPI